MPLPSSGPISADDLNEELGNSAGTQIDFDSAATSFGLTSPHGMDEFYGLSLLDSASVITPSITSHTFASGGGSVTVSVTSDGTFNINETLDWISLNKTSGAENDSFIMTASPQALGNGTRSGNVILSSDDATDKTISLSQQSNYASMDISVETPASAGGTFDIDITATDGLDWTVSKNAAAFYVTFSDTSGTGTDTITYSISQNGSNSRGPITFTLEATNVLIPDESDTVYQSANVTTFTLSDWSGNISIDGQDGTISADVGNVSSVNIDTSTFSTVSTATDRTVQFDLIGIPSGYSNTGGNLNNQTQIIEQPAYVLPTFTYADAGVSGFAVNRNTGLVTAPTNTAGTISSLTYSTGYSSGYYPAVTTSITRTVNVDVTVPSGYTNSGGTVSGTESTTQEAAQELISISSSTGTGVSGQGENFTITVDTTDVYNTSWVASITYTDPSNSPAWTQIGNTSGTGDDSFSVLVGANYSGAIGYDGTQREFSIRVDKVGGGVSSNTINFTQNTGTPPVQVPTIGVSNPGSLSLSWAYNDTSTQTITFARDGGSSETVSSATIGVLSGGNNFKLVSTNSNTTITEPSNNNWVASFDNEPGTYTVGVQPIDTNTDTSNLSGQVELQLSNTGGSDTEIISLTQEFQTNWSTDVSSLSFAAGGGTQNITLDSSFAWTAVVSGTGFSINNSSGTAGSNTISVTSTQSDLGESGTVTFSASGQSDIVVNLTQQAEPLESDWFLSVQQQTGNSLTLTPSTIAQSYAIGLYTFRGSTAVATDWELDVTSAGSWITVNTTTSGGSGNVSTTTTQSSNGTPYLYINVATNTGSSRNGSVDLQLSDGTYIATVTINQSGVAAPPPPPPGTPPPPPPSPGGGEK